MSRIGWTEETWNPVTGCSRISPGCRHCYAERMAFRLRSMGWPEYADGFRLTLHPHRLEVPLHWTKPKMVFAGSMTDLGHETIPEDFLRRVLATMHEASWHRFQLLTKRPWTLAERVARRAWPVNAWAGTTIEHPRYADRVQPLARIDAPVRFVCAEPLLGDVASALDLRGLDWVVCGLESGPGSQLDAAQRWDAERWVRRLRDACVEADVPFWFKSWGGTNAKKAGRTLDGRTWDQLPRGVPEVRA